jgi:hypothetical protein
VLGIAWKAEPADCAHCVVSDESEMVLVDEEKAWSYRRFAPWARGGSPGPELRTGPTGRESGAQG